MSAIQARTAQMVELFSQLSEKEQKALLKALKRQLILAEARELSNAVWEHETSEDEIMEMVRAVRKELHETRESRH